MRFVASAPLFFFLCGVVVFVDHAWSFITVNPGRGVLRVQLSIRSFPWTWKEQQQPTDVTRKKFFCNSLDRLEKVTTVAKAIDDDGGDGGDGGKGDNSGDENVQNDDFDDDHNENMDTLPQLERTGDPLKDQINKAKQQFAALSSEHHPCKDAFPAIEAALADGNVKPLFHALSLPESFLKSHLSSSVVTAGKVDERKKMIFDNKGKNLDEAVDVYNNKGAASIINYGMKSPWIFDYEITAFAVELVSVDAKMLGEGIECTTLDSIPIEINFKDKKSSELLTRPESRGVVSDIFRRFAKEEDEDGAVAAITGSPGIGKSWTLLYALQQALLYDGATVLFFYQKQKYAVMYLRRNNKIYAWASKSKYADSVLFQRSEVLVLLDPIEAKDGGAQLTTGRMKLLYAASNNEKHFKSDAEKNEGDMQTFLGPPLDNEMYVILERLDPKLERDVIKERQKDVGNLIRYILKESSYKHQKDLTEKNIQACAENPEELQKALRADGFSNGDNTIPGTLFQVLPKRPENLNTIGYDGQNIEYRVRVVKAVNDKVHSLILKASREAILS